MAKKTIKVKIKDISPAWRGRLFHRAIIGKFFAYLELDSVDARSIAIRCRDDIAIDVPAKPGKWDFAFEIDFDEAFTTRKQLLKVIKKVRAGVSRKKEKT